MSDITTGKKSFDIRLDDRSYQVEDNLLLLGYDVEKKEYTGQEITAEVTYILPGGQFGIEKGYVVMGIKVLNYNF